MDTSKRQETKECDDLDAIEYSPPTWDEVMAEKQSTNDHGKDTNKDIALSEVKTNGTWQTEKEVDQNENDENVNEVAIVTCFRKFINILKLISAISTITCDLILWVFGLAFLVYGCIIQEAINNPKKGKEGNMELVRVLLPNANQFRVLAQTFIASGSIYMVILVPMGLIGVLRRKRKLLKFHNLCLVICLLMEAVLFYILVARHLYVMSKEEGLKKHKENMYLYFSNCRIDDIKINETHCCCFYHTPPPPPQKKSLCWNYYTNLTKTGSGDVLEDLELYEKDCSSNNDLFLRMRDVRKQANILMPIFMIIQGTTFFFCWLVIRGLPEYDPEDYVDQILEVETPKKRKKKKINLFYRVLFYFAVKKLFYVLLVFIFGILFAIFKAWAKVTLVKIKGIPKPIELWVVVKLVFNVED